MLAAFLSFSFVILVPIKLQSKGLCFADLDKSANRGSGFEIVLINKKQELVSPTVASKHLLRSILLFIKKYIKEA